MLLHVADWVDILTDPEFDWQDEYFNRSYAAALQTQATLPIQGCMGNHEFTGEFYTKYWPYPYVAARYWSFDYGPVHITVLDQYTAYTSGSDQYNWLVNDLSSSTKLWKFILLHEPGWSAKGRGGHANSSVVQSVIQPLCVQYDVQIVFAGHNHYYARAVVDGVQHITTGGGGAPLATPAADQPYVVTYTSAFEFCKIDINGDSLAFQAIKAVDGTAIDSFTITYEPAQPGQATNPSPANSATNVALNATLSWTAGSDATSHDVYFGTDSTPDETEFKGNQTATTYNPGTLTGNTVYYWRIDEKNDIGTTTGVVWSFTTTSTITIFSDGFESGNFTAGGWTTQNSNATVATKAKYTGAYGAKLAGTTWMQKAVSTVGKSNIHVKYARKTAGLDAGEYLYVEWSIDGSVWNNLETTQSTTWASRDFACGAGANNNANFRVRWRTNANTASTEYAYVDDVLISGQ